MEHLSQDLRYCVRSFKRHPGSALTVILVLGLAVGINGIFLSFADALLFSAPVGVVQPQRVVRVPNAWLLRFDQYLDLRQNIRSLSLAGQTTRMPLSWSDGPEPELIEVRFVTHNYLSVLGANAILGRSFLPEEDGQTATAPVAVLGNSFWRRRFGAEETILGRSIRISARVFTIIGVAPEQFSGVDVDPVDVWLPARTAPEGTGLWLVGRLTGGASLDQARAELRVHYPADAPIMGDVNTGERSVRLTPISEDLTTRPGKLHPMAISMVVAGAVLLLIACANLAGLMLNRALHRRYEIAVRLQLGASRYRIVKQLWTEAILVAVTCAVVALAVVHWGTPLIQHAIIPPIPGWSVLSPFGQTLFTLDLQGYTDRVINVRMISATALSALLASIVASLGSLLYSSRVHANESIRIQRGLDPQHMRFRTLFLAAQISLTVILLVSAGLFGRSLWNALKVNHGVDTENVLVAGVDLAGSRSQGAEKKALLQRMAESVKALPGVTHTSLSRSIPIGYITKFYMSLNVPGREWPYGRDKPAGAARAFVNAVSPEYFDMLRMRILQGRGLLSSDGDTSPFVVIINDRLARDWFRGESPLGQCVIIPITRTDVECRRIVGVVSSVRNEVVRPPGTDDGEEDPALYVSADQWPVGGYVLIRTRSDAGPMMSIVRARLQEAASNLSYVKLERLSSYRDQQTHGWRVGALLFGTVSLLAIALAGIGIYAVLAFVVRQRTHEIGIRLAIGATPADIVSLGLRTGMAPVFVGIIFGVAGGMAVARLMAALLFGITAFDPLVFIGAAVVPMFVGTVACIAPCRRAMRVDPAISLRYE